MYCEDHSRQVINDECLHIYESDIAAAAYMVICATATYGHLFIKSLESAIPPL